MATRNKSPYFWKSLVVVTVGCVMALSVGCGDDDSTDVPSGGTKGTAGSGGSNTNGGSGDVQAGSSPLGLAGSTPVDMGGTTGNDTGGQPMVAAGSDAGGMAGAGGAPVVCDDATLGCYNCAPKTHVQFLNHCPTTGCEPFDNKLLTSIKKGVLPDLP